MCLHDAFQLPYLMHFCDLPNIVSCIYLAIPIFVSFISQIFIYLSLLFYMQEEYPARYVTTGSVTYTSSMRAERNYAFLLFAMPAQI